MGCSYTPLSYVGAIIYLDPNLQYKTQHPPPKKNKKTNNKQTNKKKHQLQLQLHLSDQRVCCLLRCVLY